MERDVPFNFLNILMNMSVQDADRSESLQIGKRLETVFGTPAPLLINGPERYVSENGNRRVAFLSFQILFEPLQLLASQVAQSSGLEIEDVYQAYEMHSIRIEAEPAVTLCIF